MQVFIVPKLQAFKIWPKMAYLKRHAKTINNLTYRCVNIIKIGTGKF